MFYLTKFENARMNVPEPVYYEAADEEAIAEGEALVLSGGKLTKCPATTKPAFIAIGTKTADDKNRIVGVARVEAGQVYEVPVTADPADLVAGDKVTLADDGLRVTATTASGVVTVVSKNGAVDAGDKIVVRIE